MSNNTDILIVGAGPTGLSLACDLARRGVSWRLIDRKSGPSTIMKATVLTPSTLDYFEDLGFFDRARETGTAVRYMTIYADGEIVVRRGWDSLDAPHPYMLLLGQHYTERFLNDRLGELGGTVEWDTELESFTVDDGVSATIKELSGRSQEIKARYLVGCDGGHSAVAQGLGVEYRDLDFATDYVIAELEIDTDLPRQDWHIFFAKDGPLAIGAMPNGLWGAMAALPPLPDGKSRVGTEPSLDEMQSLWDRRSPYKARVSNPRWMSHYRTHLRSAIGPSRLPVILAGDAAHQVSPLSSLGMNSGILDARNLGWKLDLACRELAGPDLLPSYDREHRAQAEPAKVLTVLNEVAYPWRAAPLRLYRDWSFRILLNFDPLWDYYVKYQSQRARNLRSSPIVSQQIGFPVHRPSSPHLSDHSSCTSAWLAFGEGPHAGDPARDVPDLVEASTSATVRLFEKLYGGFHTLVVFGGCEEPDEEMRTNFTLLETSCRELPDGLLKTLFVHLGDSLPKGLWTGEALLDRGGAAHARYGADGECLYLIRPDGYVGYRALPPLWGPLKDYLKTVFGV